jgi:8-oxo-dGTP diphosphatase
LEEFSTPLLVVAVAILDRDGRVLMQRRRQDAVHGGLWEFPGGKVEAGETAEMAALREIDEELGLSLDASELAPLTFASGRAARPSDGSRGLVLLLYTCRRWQGEARCRAGEEIRWFAAEELRGLAMPPLDYPLADALGAAIRQNFRKALAKPE